MTRYNWRGLHPWGGGGKRWEGPGGFPESAEAGGCTAGGRADPVAA